MKGRTDEAHDVIARLLGENKDHLAVLEELNSIQESLYIQTRGGGFKYRELLTNGPSQNFRRTFLGALSQFCQQFCGINLVVSTIHIDSLCTPFSSDIDLLRYLHLRKLTGFRCKPVSPHLRWHWNGVLHGIAPSYSSN